jgi:tetratricopeptide (TPR) repeat protein
VYLSLLVDGWLGGGRPAVYHLTNLLLHMLNTLLVARLLVLLLRSGVPALAGGLLFAVHPVQVEAVAFVAARTDLWATFFTLLATLAWLASRGSGLPRSSRALFVAAAAGAYAAGSLSKETAVLLPVVLCAWDVLGVGRPDGTPAGWWARNGAAALAFALALVAVTAARAHALGSVLVTGGPEAAVQGPLALREPGLACAAALRLLGLLAVPWPLNTMYTREHLVFAPASAAAAALLVAAMVWLGSAFHSRVGWVAGAWIVVFLAPALLVPSGSATLAAERYLYLPAVGAALLFGAACRWVAALPGRTRELGLGIAAAGLVLCAALSAVRADVWRDDLSLTTDQLRTAPGSAFAHDLHGQALLKRERWADALAQFQRAVELEPTDPGYHNDLGIALRRTERPDLAVRAFRESLRLDPGVAGTRLNLAYACISLRDLACIEEQRAALARLDPVALAVLDAELARWGLGRRAGR